MPLRSIVLAFALVLAACTGSGSSSVPETIPPATSLPLTTPPATAESTAPPATTAPPVTQAPEVTGPKDPLSAQIEELMAVTEEIRGLEFLHTPDITILDREGVAERILQLFEEDVDPDQYAATDELYTVLGLLPEKDDLLHLLRELQAEQVVAFYATESKELVAPATEGEFTATEKITMVHELTHALTDQHFDLFSTMDRLDQEQRYDEASAYRALIEGDATVTETLYLQRFTREELFGFLQDVLALESPVFDSSPQFLQDSLLFPYLAGRELVSSIWTADGFRGVDDAYFDYPSTTEHVLDPGTYFNAEAALPVTLPAVDLSNYELIEASTWGQLGLQTMFDQVLPGATARTAARGWGGDRYELFWNGRDMAFVLSYLGDSEQEAVELHDALSEFVNESMAVGVGASDGSGTAFGGEDYAFVSRNGDRVLFIAASDVGTGVTVRSGFTDF